MAIQRKAQALVVVGGGVAGLSAAIAAARLGLEVTVVDRLGPGGQTNNVGRITNYPGFPAGIDGLELGPLLTEQAVNAGVRVSPEDVRAVEPAGARRWRLLTDGPELAADSIVIATGSHLAKLGIERESQLYGRGISNCATCDAPMYVGKDVVVVGGGDSAVDEALHLSEVVRQVTVVTRDPHLTAASTTAATLIARQNVSVLYRHEAFALLGDPVLDAVVVRDLASGRERTLAASGLFVFTGLVPNSQLVHGVADVDPAGHIVVKLDLSTTAPGIYAAGDVRAGAAGYFVTAAADGALAADSAFSYMSAKVDA